MTPPRPNAFNLNDLMSAQQQFQQLQPLPLYSSARPQSPSASEVPSPAISLSVASAAPWNAAPVLEVLGLFFVTSSSQPLALNPEVSPSSSIPQRSREASGRVGARPGWSPHCRGPTWWPKSTA